jgi:hypothetical protein
MALKKIFDDDLGSALHVLGREAFGVVGLLAGSPYFRAVPTDNGCPCMEIF